MIVRPYGDAAVLVEVDDPSAILGLRDALTDVPGIEEMLPAARTLLVRFDGRRTGVDELTEAVRTVEHSPGRHHCGGHVDLEVHYDGADLDDVAAAVGCSAATLIERHAAGEYTVAFCGFAPGFAYLTGLEPALHVARMSSPRTSVPAGSVGVAGEFTGVYPRSSPGGWRLLGHTDATLWDPDRTPPALLTPGTSVRFVPR